MERDRDRDRRPYPPIPPEDQYGDGRGQSYRPNRSPMRSDTYRAPRSPLRGAPFGDSYRGPPRRRSRSPPPFRRRSRSPPPFRPRDGGDNYRGRARSPPRRDFAREGNYRPGPPREGYRDEPSFGNWSPARNLRDRSPLPLKRPRDISPAGSRGRRSPLPPAKRERLASPPRPRYGGFPASRDVSPPRARGFSPSDRARRLTPPRGVTRDYRPSSRSPLRRNEHNDPRKVDWRRRSPSPARHLKPDLISTENSGAQSVTSSRRSSPPIHPSRLAIVDPEERPSRPAPRDDPPPARPSYRTRSPPPPRPRSPAPVRARSPIPVRPRSPPPIAARSPPRIARSPPPPQKRDSPVREREPPTGPARGAPPTGPARHDEPPTGPARAIPTGPGGARSYAQAAGDPVIPTGPRPTVIPPPSHPRWGPAPGRGGFQRDYPTRDYPPRGDFQGPRGRGGYSSMQWRGGRGGAPPPSSYNRDQEFQPGPPSGPRGSMPQPGPPPFRQNSTSSSATYPRSTRFAPNGAPIPDAPRAGVTQVGYDRKPSNPYLGDLPRIVEGGQKAPDLYDHSRLDKLEEEAEKLRRVIDDKQIKKRRGLREWDRLERESEAAGLRAQLADESVRALAGENDGGAAF